MKLEQLLNELIALWWKPRWEENDKDIRITTWKYTSIRVWTNFDDWVLIRNLNDLCSVSSGLRQFVCEKGLYDRERKDRIHLNYCNTHQEWFEKNERSLLSNHYFEQKDYEYRLMISSIQIDKSKFLLDNIILPPKKDK